MIVLLFIIGTIYYAGIAGIIFTIFFYPFYRKYEKKQIAKRNQWYTEMLDIVRNAWKNGLDDF